MSHSATSADAQGFILKVFKRGELQMRKSHIAGLVLLALVMVFMPARSSAQISVGVAVHIGPPALPVYEQPICPGAGYLWTPGYWAYGDDGYYWVPGTWVMAPPGGFFWTQDIGDRQSDSTAGLIMDLDMAELVSLADAGTAECSRTTRR